MKIFALGAAMITLVLAGASSAAADDLPVCPPDDETLSTSTPTYLRLDESFKVSVDGGTGTNITVQVGEQVIPLTQDASGEAVVIVNGPTALGTFDIIFSWDQNLGTTQACHGVDLTTLQVIPAESKAGDPDIARLTGKYDLTFRRAGYKTASLWSAKPRCDFFGCASRVESNPGTHGVLTPSDNGHYAIKPRHYTQSYCTLTYASGRRVIVRPWVNVTQTLDVKPTKVEDGVVQRFSGTEVLHFVTTSRARNRGCPKKDARQRYTITGVRR